MAFDDLLVRNDVQRMGVNASIDWIRQCIAHAQSQGTPDSKLATFILDMYLLADFRTLDPKALLPTATQTPHKQTLFNDDGQKEPLGRQRGGGAILQIVEIQDIGISSLKMLEACDAVGVAGDEPGGLQVGKSLPQGNLTLDLTDGTRLIRAVLLEPIFGIAMEMLLGAKIRIRNAEVRHGMLMISPKNTFLLGGEVASMNQYPRRLVIMNQMKKRLGLPMDAIPGLNQNGANSASAAPSAGRQAVIDIAPIINNNSRSTITINNSSTNNSNANPNIWKNLQPAVSAQDAVPSRTLSTQVAQAPLSSPASNANTNKDKEAPYNPWKSFQRHNTPSPPPPPDHRENEYLQLQREQEPVWNYHEDMEFDNIDLAASDGGWEVMSQLSVNGKGLTKPDVTKSKDGSPPLIATLSPSRRLSSIRKSISLRAPHSQDKDKGREEWEVDRLPKSHASNSNGGSGSNSNIHGKSGSSERVADGPSSPRVSDLLTEYHRTLELQKASLNEQTSRRGELNHGKYDQDVDVLDYNDPFQDHKALNDDELLDRKKRRTLPDSRDSPDQDHYPSRRRSQSFSTSNWNDEETRVDIKLEPGTYDSQSNTDSMPVAIGKDNGNMEKEIETERQEEKDIQPMSLPVKVKVEAAEVSGVSHAVIDLSSDDDGDTDKANGSRTSGSQGVRVKQEPGKGTSSKMDKMRGSTSWIPVKQEETLLEFEMDNEEDFGGLDEVIPIVPFVELTQVEQDVRNGREVKVKARVHKLGKFSLTTMSASIPIILLPVEPIPERDDLPFSDDNAFKLKAVLEQRVLEVLFQFSIQEFRKLVQTSDVEAKRAVENLRATLLEVDLVECMFKGLRIGIPVIREFTVLTKKQKKKVTRRRLVQ
ncbi:hypothetical protein EC991_007725 [Linnemannia zychae]|nr:hypothetical protein EC991_007725 [Linnemannia zychae]